MATGALPDFDPVAFPADATIVEKLSPADRLAQAQRPSARVVWYVIAVVMAVLSAMVTWWVQRTTGGIYTFIPFVPLCLVAFGGLGPSAIATLGSLALLAAITPAGTLLTGSTEGLVRLVANGCLMSLAAGLAGLYRQSRLGMYEREAKLAAAATSMRELLESSTEAVVLTDAELRVAYVNAQAEEMFGYRRADLLGRDLLSFISPESIAQRPVQLEPLTRGETMRVERTVLHKDGSRVDIDVSARFISGRRLLASMRDATIRKREEERQRSERELFDGILATSVAAILVIDRDDRIIFANHRAVELLQLTRTSPQASTYGAIGFQVESLDGTPQPREAQPYVRVLHSGRPVFDVRSRLRWPDGRVIAVSAHGAPLHGLDGSLKAVVLAISDITDALAADAAIREGNHRLEQVTEAMPGMVVQFHQETDGTRRFVYVSRFSEQLLGCSPEAVLADAERAFGMVHPDDRSLVDASLAQAGRDMEPWTAEFRLRDPRDHEKWRWANARAVPQQGPQPGTLLWNGVFLDITERKVLEHELRQAQKIESVGRLAGSIAHDFNNLLTVILGESELLAMTLPMDDARARGIMQIRTAAESGAALTRQLLGFTRKHAVAPTLVSANALVERVPDLLKRLLGATFDLDLDLMPAPPSVRVDAAQFDQVLINLAVNARDAMPKGGRVNIRTRGIASDAPERADYPMLAAGPLVEISVQDHGVGMSDEVRQRAFEPFFTTKGLGKGTGLGLATCYGIVTQAGGTMLIDSVLGKGTTVRILIPARPAVVEGTVAEAGRRLHTGTELVLVADDDEAVRRVTCTALKRQGYQILEAESGADALALLRVNGDTVRLLVTDVVMPKMTGPELAELAWRDWPDLRVLFVTGYEDGSISTAMKHRRGIAVLQKPYDFAELNAQVRSLIELA